MIVIYGLRWYGRAFAHRGEGLATRGFHIYYVPLFPTRQLWVTSRNGRNLRGIPVRWSWRAAMPVFACQWAIAAALIATGAPLVAGPLTATALALGVWGFLGGYRSNARQRAASELTASVLGTSCPPERMQPAKLVALTPQLDALWARTCPDRAPEDVAALGPRDRREAALAYTLLAVRAGYEPRALATTLHHQADQVLAAIDRTPELPQGAPYRAEILLPEVVASEASR